jgi:hypothetical protein
MPERTRAARGARARRVENDAAVPSAPPSRRGPPADKVTCGGTASGLPAIGALAAPRRPDRGLTWLAAPEATRVGLAAPEDMGTGGANLPVSLEWSG